MENTNPMGLLGMFEAYLKTLVATAVAEALAEQAAGKAAGHLLDDELMEKVRGLVDNRTDELFDSHVNTYAHYSSGDICDIIGGEGYVTRSEIDEKIDEKMSDADYVTKDDLTEKVEEVLENGSFTFNT